MEGSSGLIVMFPVLIYGPIMEWVPNLGFSGAALPFTSIFDTLMNSVLSTMVCSTGIIMAIHRSF